MDPAFAALLPVLRLKYKFQDRELATPQDIQAELAAATQRAHTAFARNVALSAEYEGQDVFVLITTMPKKSSPQQG